MDERNEQAGSHELRCDRSPGGTGDPEVDHVDEHDLEDDVDGVGHEGDVKGPAGVPEAVQVAGAGEGGDEGHHPEREMRKYSTASRATSPRAPRTSVTGTAKAKMSRADTAPRTTEST